MDTHVHFYKGQEFRVQDFGSILPPDLYCPQKVQDGIEVRHTEPLVAEAEEGQADGDVRVGEL